MKNQKTFSRGLGLMVAFAGSVSVGSGCAPKVVTMSGTPTSANTQIQQAATGGGKNYSEVARMTKTSTCLKSIFSTADCAVSDVIAKGASRTDQLSALEADESTKQRAAGIILADKQTALGRKDKLIDLDISAKVDVVDNLGRKVLEENFGSFRGKINEKVNSVILKDKMGVEKEFALPDTMTGTTTVAQVSPERVVVTNGKVLQVLDGASKSVAAIFTNLGSVSAGKVAVSMKDGSTARIGRTDANGKLVSVTDVNLNTGSSVNVPLNSALNATMGL